MMCFHKGPLVLHYALQSCERYPSVNFSQFYPEFVYLQKVCNSGFTICPFLLGIYCVTDKLRIE